MRQPRKMTFLSVSILALLSSIVTDGGVRCGRLIGYGTIYYSHRALLPISLADDSIIILSRTIQWHFSNVCEGSFLCRGNEGDGVMLGFCLILFSPHLGCKDTECSKPKLGIWAGRRQCNFFCLSFLSLSWRGKQLYGNENSRGIVAN